ncbi:protoporphyrinogen oxidase [Fictibacillus macauensis ZFHKF-1]|uniref:Coproporphyrinogen III oxidase n=1 Tax=Fictibacillus macauensis ZFHKF-1 TaxID=1196324 RepID=I8UG08_9BACL|nr:protoporphyrinogen oxidase [Fictibacillus macauensis]EIT85835.1 protoporphyrinogen oxidase [Fictibacillus macauensis ZFHKF-1]
MSQHQHVMIIGGGITGLTAAFYLQKEAKENGVPVTYTLIEGSERLGGKIETIYRDGFTIERGPDSYLGRKKSMTTLIENVGLKEQLVTNETGQAYVLSGGKLHPIPEGAVMGIPTKMGPFVKTGLFSLGGKARASLDLVLPRRAEPEKDISVGHFFRRRLGNEVVENLIEPLLSGIYAGNIDRLSLQSTFPQFQDVERKSRSLILGMKHTLPKPSDRPGTYGKKKKGQFLTLSTGLSSLVKRLEELLDADSVLKGEKVTELVKLASGGYSVELESGRSIQGDSVIMATPYTTMKELLSEEVAVEGFHATPSTSVATVAMAFDQSALKKDINGTGFVISRKEPTTITACTWTHRKWPHTTPDHQVLLRCYVGRANDQEIVFQSDEEILQAVLEDLKNIMGITDQPTFYYVSRWVKSMPQYEVDHKQHWETLQENLTKQYPDIYAAGASYEGVGLPDCVASAEKAVENIIQKLRL